MQDRGFTKFTARNAWRFSDDGICVVNFQSFSSSLAGSLGCTTYSFALNLGVFYPCITPRHDPNVPASRLVSAADPPAEPECHARRHPHKTLTQPEFIRENIWYVRPDGSKIDETVNDARRVVLETGLPWLDRFSDLRYTLAQYLTPHTLGQIPAVATLGSVACARAGAAIALHLNDPAAAALLWQSVLDNAFYAKLPVFLEEARQALAVIMGGAQVAHNNASTTIPSNLRPPPPHP